MEARFEQFIRERQYLTNVTPATIEWYRRCLKWLPSESPTQTDLRVVVLRMREKGLKETGVNTVLRCVNAYLHWSSGSERKCGAGCTHPRIATTERASSRAAHVHRCAIKLLVAWKPKGQYQRRLHLLILLLLDTGCRISEALTLRVSDVNFENLLVTLDGKGRKQRVVPFSFELRKALFRYCKELRSQAGLAALCQPDGDHVEPPKCLAGREAALPQAWIHASRPHASTRSGIPSR